LRRFLALTALAAALVCVTSASASLVPVRRTLGDRTVPRLRAGVVRIPAGHASARVRVIVGLRLPPLAAAYADRALASTGSVRRLNVASASSRAYLARVDAAQRAAMREIRRAIPQARVSRRYRVVLDGFAVSLPMRRLPALVRLRGVAKVYPSLPYSIATNRSPSVIGADVLRATTGATGEGVKIGVVDTGVDPRNPFLDPAGFSYPPGFPKGLASATTPKVIVARVFPGPGSGPPGRLVVNVRDPHGTHVSGIAAGDSGTTAPPGADHPLVTGLSGVAPRAWIGNYRVFTVPTPVGNTANTPEIVAAFEAAVSDGMNVINFSGGGPQTDPANDALNEAVRNTAAAGVVPVIAAGNDRDEYGLGSVGSPGTAPDAIAVAAVTDTHVFAPALSVVAPGAPDALREVPFQPGAGGLPPPAWGATDQTLVDVGSLVGPGGTPVDRHLCGSGENANDPRDNPLPERSLAGSIALVSRGICTFVSKAQRAQAAGAIGIVLVDNRPGNPNPIPVRLPIPAGMISDLDGQRLRDAMAATGGRTTIRVDRAIHEIGNGRSGIVTSFSSAGPTDFGHDLKPDVSAPGSQILSSVTREFDPSQFSVFDGTSMATPHVAGSAALLVQQHRDWSAQQIKSALVSTAGPAWADTARTQEAPVLLEGGGLVNLPRANDPLVFTDPVSLSFHRLNVTAGTASRGDLVRISDAGGGEGTWTVELRPQAATAGATLAVPSTVALAPGGEAELPVVARAGGDAQTGENYGFLVLRRGETTRRIPYDFLVERPALAEAPVRPLQRFQLGSTLVGTSRVDHYCCPDAPFGPPPDYTGPTQQEDGAEQVYVTHLNRAAANLGVAVVVSSAGSVIDPWVLGSLDENDVQGYAGLPVDVNPLTFDFPLDIGAAGAASPRQQTFYVSVDSGRDPFTGRSLAGRYVLRSWVNDVRPPTIRLLTKRVAAGRPTLVARVVDAGAGVDPLSLVIAYERVLVGAAAYDPVAGIAVFPLPAAAPRITATTAAILVASDYQESKNVNTVGADIMPNTAFSAVKLRAVSGPALSWIVPERNECVAVRTRLVVAASATRKIASVRFFDGGRPIATVTRGQSGLYFADWTTARAKPGRHVLRAVVTAAGRHSAVTRLVRVCRR
jgi:subtilisin family serine protease